MQLVEYFVWTYSGNSTVNFVASLAAAFLLWLQPIASILTMPNQFQRYPIVIYVFLSVLILFFERRPFKEKYKMVRAENGHLSWKFLDTSTETYLQLGIYFFFLLTPLILYKEYLLLSVVLLTLGVSLHQFYTSNTWGSMWCWLVNYIVVGIGIRQVLIS